MAKQFLLVITKNAAKNKSSFDKKHISASDYSFDHSDYSRSGDKLRFKKESQLLV